MDPSNAEIEKNNLTVFDWSEHIFCFTSMFYLTYSSFQKNEWIEVCFTLERNLSIVNLDHISSTFYFYGHSLLFPSKKCQVIFLQNHGSCFMNRSTSFQAVFCAKEHISKYWSSQSTCEPRVESPNHLANLNESTNVPLKTKESLLKNPGWKMTFPFEVVPFQGNMLSFGG